MIIRRTVSINGINQAGSIGSAYHAIVLNNPENPTLLIRMNKHPKHIRLIPRHIVGAAVNKDAGPPAG